MNNTGQSFHQGAMSAMGEKLPLRPSRQEWVETRKSEDNRIAALLYCGTTSWYVSEAGEEIYVNHGIVDVFAFQEALLVEAIFGISLLTMIWVGFRRWLQHKEKMGRLITDQMAEHTAQYGVQMQRVEARLKAVEEILSEGGVQTAPQNDALSANPARPALKARRKSI